MPLTDPLSRSLAILFGVLIIAVSWLVAKLLRGLLRRAIRRMFDDSPVIGVVVTGPYYLVILVGILIGLDQMGVRIAPILTGLGLGGFVLGLALRDVLSNLISGVMMLLYKPFERGDSVTVSGYNGEVEEINLRYTTLRRDGERFLIPNSTLLSSPIKLVQRQERTS